jgi:hypothetical protein
VAGGTGRVAEDMRSPAPRQNGISSARTGSSSAGLRRRGGRSSSGASATVGACLTGGGRRERGRTDAVVGHFVPSHDLARRRLVLRRTDLDEGVPSFEVDGLDLHAPRRRQAQGLQHEAGPAAAAGAEHEAVPRRLLADVLALRHDEAQRPALVAGTGGARAHFGDAAEVGAGGNGDEVGYAVAVVEVDFHWVLLRSRPRQRAAQWGTTRRFGRTRLENPLQEGQVQVGAGPWPGVARRARAATRESADGPKKQRSTTHAARTWHWRA